MKIAVKNSNFSFITDSTNECGKDVAFVRTAQNSIYLDIAMSKNAQIITVQEAKDLLHVDKNLKVIGITGTNGKTTTAGAIYSMMLDLGYGCALQGTRGCFINDERVDEKSLTTPPILQTLLHMSLASKMGCKYFVMEVSSHAISQQRVEGLEFALKIFTNLTQDHLDFHKSLEEYAIVKSSFFEEDALKLINADAKKIN